MVLTPPHHRFRLMRSSHHGPRLYFVGARAICPIYALFGRHYDRRGQWGSDALARCCVDCACLRNLGSDRGRRRATAEIDGAGPANRPVPRRLAGEPAFSGRVFLIVHFSLAPKIWLSPLTILGTQWYILFNVIAGASAFPSDFREPPRAFGLAPGAGGAKLCFPGFSPYYVTGAITAAGGAWNASIVAEAVSWRSERLGASGLGAYSRR